MKAGGWSSKTGNSKPRVPSDSRRTVLSFLPLSRPQVKVLSVLRPILVSDLFPLRFQDSNDGAERCAETPAMEAEEPGPQNFGDVPIRCGGHWLLRLPALEMWLVRLRD